MATRLKCTIEELISLEDNGLCKDDRMIIGYFQEVESDPLRILPSKVETDGDGEPYADKLDRRYRFFAYICSEEFHVEGARGFIKQLMELAERQQRETRKQNPFPHVPGGILTKRCRHCGGRIVSSSGGVIVEYCENCKTTYQEPVYGGYMRSHD